jgi:hypothetical protein
MDFLIAMDELRDLDPDMVVETLDISTADLLQYLEDYIIEWAEDREEV